VAEGRHLDTRPEEVEEALPKATDVNPGSPEVSVSVLGKDKDLGEKDAARKRLRPAVRLDVLP
jgi:hypothetical protein